jgi:methionyl-tRNA formyltransferase|tara:strand:+ start:1553 stop:2110 length:558 start_codon:yes stop_codon:yes gene_type:complete
MIIVTSAKYRQALLPVIAIHKNYLDDRGEEIIWIHGKRDLTLLPELDGQCLICFNTGIIIPEEILDRLARRTYNFHAAPPEFPGRDPHHWAIYRGARTFGATCHVMTKKVDDGQILAVKRFDIECGLTAEQLVLQAIDLTYGMFDELLANMLEGKLAPTGDTWGPIKTTRADSLRMRGERGFENF